MSKPSAWLALRTFPVLGIVSEALPSFRIPTVRPSSEPTRADDLGAAGALRRCSALTAGVAAGTDALPHLSSVWC